MKQYRPPRLGVRLLRKIYTSELFDEVYGDLHEIFMDRVEERGIWFARHQFIIDSLLSIRNYDLRRRKKVTQNNTIAMFNNYFKITLRNITKDKTYSLLNIFGLALGIAAFIFILQYVSYERSYDKFHRSHENLYRIRYKVYQAGDLHIDCAAAVPRVGPFMKEKMPEVIDFARAFPVDGIISKDQITYREDRIHIVDPSFLKIFDFPLIRGNLGTVLTAPNQMVITEEIANKYFGSTDVIGKTLKYTSWVKGDFEIVGVTENVPDNSHFKYDFLISYETLNEHTRREDGTSSSETQWGWYDFNSYVLLRDGTDPIAFDKKFDEYVREDRKEEMEKYDFRPEFPLQPITDIHLYSNLLQESEPEEQGDGQAVALLTIIAVFILVIAWINYINLATARSTERAKEVGIRKTMGAYKNQLVYQFIAEAFILNLLSLVLGILIVLVGIRSFNQLTDSTLSTTFLLDGSFWLIGLGIFILGVLLSGLYPAFVLSSFEPVQVLKGKFIRNDKGNTLRRTLVTFQFAASISLIAGTFIVFQQLKHMNNTDLGFSIGNKMVVKSPSIFQVDSLSGSIAKTFRTELARNPMIRDITISSNVPGDEIFWTSGMKRLEDTKDKYHTMYNVSIDDKYFPLYDIEIIAGRNFDHKLAIDTGSVILNQSAINLLGYTSAEEAINRKVNFRGSVFTIVGVVDNYNQMSVKNDVSPITFLRDEEDFNYLTISMETDDYKSLMSEVESAYLDFFPGNPFEFFFLDDFFNRQYANERTFSNVFTLFAVFAIVVACLGLFGLASFSALQKTKEIGVRKVLGAKIKQIVILLSKEFVVLIAIANVIAWPAVYFAMDSWLNGFASRINVSFLVLVISGILVLLIALITVGYKIIRTAKANPVNALRYE